MKVLGVTVQGELLVEIAAREMHALEVLRQGAAPLFVDPAVPRLIPPDAGALPGPAPAPEKKTEPKRTKRTCTKPKVARSERTKACIVCRKAFVDDSLRNQRKFCGEKCRQQHASAESAKRCRAWREKQAAKPKGAIPPERPPERPPKLSRQERLAMIRKADSKLTTEGILDQAGQTAAALAREENGN